MPTINAPACQPQLIAVLDDAGVEQLAAEILDPTRQHPLILLTTRSGSDEPALDAADIRQTVGPDAPIYSMATGALTLKLAQLLPPKLNAYNGAARIWWPGVDRSSDPHDHPLIHDRYGVYGTKALKDFDREFQRGAPRKPGRLSNPQAAVLQRARDQARKHVKALQGQVAGLEGELREARERASDAERRLQAERRRGSRVPAPAQRPDPSGIEESFHRAVLTAWLESTTADDRRAFPLKGYRLHADFLASVDELAGVPADRIAWVCAMIASRRAHELDGLALHPLRSGDGANDPVKVRADGAQAMRCALKRRTPAAPRLHYWLVSDGTVEFACVGPHDHVGIPE